MKSRSTIIAAIDIGSEKVTTLIANVQTELTDLSKVINVIGVAASESGEGRGIKKGQIVNLEEAVDAVIESVESAERMAGHNVTKAYLALGGAHILSQNSHGVVAISNPEGEITQADINRVIDAASAVSLPPSRVLIHVIPKEFIVDGDSGIKDPLRMEGVRLEAEAHLITASSSAVKNIEKVLDEVGIKVEEFIYSGIASSDAVLTKTEKELGCVMIDIGAGTTSIAVYEEGSLTYSYVLPIGSRNVTKDLATGLRVSLEAAEKIKLSLNPLREKKGTEAEEYLDLTKYDAGEDKKVSRKTVLEGIIRPRLNEIFSMVKTQLEKEKLINKIPSGAIITGGGAQVYGVEESGKRLLSLPVRIGKPHGVEGLVDEILNTSFSVPIGVLINASKKEPKDHLTSISKRLKLPTIGILAKLAKIFKDLLP
ncbi:MAG: Cell division protein ftsA [Candidatus Woesebacteria bacterium GW2011_GWA1_39_21]|uniref:Cell division protein FtsA n=1 Tax=Candidatus Woesebacteria bacterium GW2011_GWA1_39_21 TaxID=1618550 RepID=A0A0G0RDP6_9BACT|nr:MAG: Cell division protein ftsA [Candidatus Woesebacteria bacterium GW2011_GWA1_39_21]